jgi:hypothetical protein
MVGLDADGHHFPDEQLACQAAQSKRRPRRIFPRFDGDALAEWGRDKLMDESLEL